MKKQITLRLNPEEFKELTEKAQKVGMKKEPFMRSLIMEQGHNIKGKSELIKGISELAKGAENEELKAKLIEIMLIAKEL